MIAEKADDQAVLRSLADAADGNLDRYAARVAPPLMLSAEQQRHCERACAFVSESGLTDLVADLVNVPSPTGEEEPLACAIVDRLANQRLTAWEQKLSDRQANAVALQKGSREGPPLLLYAPLDTVTSNCAAEDVPWAAPSLLPEMQAKAVVRDGHVFGLGAHNPKGHAACVIAAFEAIAKAEVPLTRDLMVGLGAGGMPTNSRPGMRPKTGHGAGCEWMLEHIEKPACAIIAKSGWSVSWEEVGLAWYEVQVLGSHTYVGSRHLLPYANAIERAGTVIAELERWFPEWASENRSGLVEPQGVVSFIEGGWERMPAFTPAMCRFRFDLRVSPRTTVEEADRAIEQQLKEISARRNIPLSWRRLVFIPGTTTDPGSEIVKTAIEAWENIAGSPHRPTVRTSGATDANILRAYHIPTARVGLPKAALPGIDFQQGMNTVCIADMAKLTRLFVYSAIKTCTYGSKAGRRAL